MHVSGTVSAGSYAGGIVGSLNGTISGASSSATVNVTVTAAGGLLGELSGSLRQSYATGDIVAAGDLAGGLVGVQQTNAAIAQSYFTGTVKAANYAGGLVGIANFSTTITDSYAMGAVAVGSNYAGGLVGRLNGGQINTSYAVNYVLGSFSGGLVGLNSSGTVGNLFWVSSVAGKSNAAGSGSLNGSASARTIAQLQAGLPAGFSSAVWGTIAGTAYPYLQWRFPTGPSVIDGNGGVGRGIALTVGGQVVDRVIAGSLGDFYAALDPLAPGGMAIATWDGRLFNASGLTTTTGISTGIVDLATVAGSSAGHALDLILATNTLTILSAKSNLSSIVAGIDTAAGATPTGAYLFSTAGGDLTGATHTTINFNSTASAFTLDRSMSTAGSGTILLRLTTADSTLTLNSGETLGAATTSGTGVAVSAPKLINNAGTSVFSLAGAARYLVYADDWETSSLGGLGGADRNIYNATVQSLVPSAVSGAASKIIWKRAATLTVTVANGSRTYGSAFAGGSASITGLVNGDTNAAYSGSVLVTDTSALTADAGSYAGVLKGNGLLSSAGYTIVYQAGTLTIDQAVLTASLTGTVSKTYDGSTGATLTAANYTLGTPLFSDQVTLSPVLTGTYDATGVGSGRTVTVTGLTLDGPDAGNYRLSATTLQAPIGTITAKVLTASLTGTGSKIYDGTTDIALTAANYQLAGVIGGDAVTLVPDLTGELTDANVGTGKTVNVSGLGLTGAGAANYTIAPTLSGTIGTVTARPLTITAAAKSRAYGDVNPALTYAVTSGTLVGSDALTGSLATVATTVSSAGTYAITQGTLSASTNYALTYVGADLTVTKRALTVTADSASRAYGDANPSFTYQVTTGTLVNGDTLTGGLTTVATGTSGIGIYAITQGTLSASANYALTYVGADLTVTKRALTVTADAVSRAYGDANPSFTYQITTGTLVNGDTLTGALTTVATGTSGIGTYAITQGTLSASVNYALTYVGADLTVTKRALTVTADAASRAYGDANPSFTYQITTGTLVNGDALTGALTTTATGTSGIGTYAITQGTLSASVNYALTYVGADLTVMKRALTVTADAASRSYGDSNPSFTYQVTTGTLVNGDTLTGVLATAATGTSGIGTYAITQGTLSASTNYALTYVGADLTVTKRALTVTADAASRAYGDANPSFTHQVTAGTLVNGDTLTGGLTTAATGTSGIGIYAITQGTLSASANYALTYVGADLTVTKRALTVAADAASRAYGDSNPSFTYQVTTGTLVNGDTLTGALATAATGTSGIGTYAITQGTLAASANYALTYVGADLTVTKRALTVTAGAASRAYGDTNPSFTYQVTTGTLVNGDALTGGLTTTATGISGIGTYAITQGTLSASANYALTYVGADLTVTKRALTVTADAASRSYGDTNPSFTYQVTTGTLVNGDTLSGNLTTAATGTSGIGTYTITQGTLSASTNYALTYVGADLTVTKRALTVTADAASRAYGDANPSFTYQVTTGTLVNGDTLTGALATAATGISGIGAYAITQGTLSASANYALTYVGADLTVTKRALTVTADAASRSYGDANPSFTYQVTTGTLVNGDTLTGALTTVATGTSGIGIYAITQGTLAASANYALTYVGADLTVTKRALTVTADAASRSYGDANPSFTYQVTTGTLVNGDTLTGALATAATGISGIGAYAITQGTLSASANYALTYVGADLTVTKRALTVTADAAGRAYGDTNPSFTYQIAAGTLVNGDTLTGALATAATGTSGIGTYAITQGTLSASANYALTYVGADLTVTKRALTVTADAAGRAYGDTNPSFTYQVTTGTLVNGDALTGALATAATGTSGIGTYAITQGTLAASANYALTYVGADLTVTKRALTVTADAASRAYGDTNPSFTYQVTTGTLVNGDTLTGALATAATGISGIGAYAITQGTLSASANYALTYVGADLTVTKRALTVTADAASRSYGDANPSFTYQVTTGTLVNGDTLTGALTTVATGTSGIGIYAITQGTLAASANYALTYVGADLTVTKRALTVTADAASRAYGDTNPSFTYQVTTGTLVNGDTLTGALATAATGISGIGAYAITQGTLSASANYALTYVGADLTVMKRALTVTADAAGRAYGDTNPSFTYQIAAGTLVNGDTLTGALATAATGTSGIGTYAITQGTLSATANYVLTYVGADLTVTMRALTVTADAASRAYGDTNPSFTYQVTTGTLVNGDTLTGALAAAATGISGIGAYAITQGTLSASANYALTYVGADLTVMMRALTVTADAASRAYGDANPSFTYQVTSGTLVNGDTLTGSLTTVATGSSGIGTYAITQGTLAASANYALTYVGADLTVTKRALTVTADAASRAYGDTNPSFTYQIAAGTLVNGDTLTGGLTTTATGTSGIGTYAITQGTLSASTNYALTYVGAGLTVVKRALTVTADAASRAYGDSNPSFTYQVTTGILVNGDALSGALATSATGTSGIGTYAITQGTLAASTNYALTYVGADLTVTKRALTVTADAASRAYGDTNPSFTYQVTTGTLVNGDTLTGALTTTATGTSGIGTYAITQGTLSASANYALTYVGADLTVTKRALTVTADAASRAYGDANPSFTYQITAGTLVNGDTLTGALATAATGTSGIGTYTITQGTLAASANYALTYVGADLSVTKRALTVTADAASRVYGDANPSFTYQVTTGTLVNGDTLTGGLTTAATGTSGIGTYAITQGTLSASANYALTYVGADLTVTKRALTVTADAASRAYGDTNPSFTHQVTAGTLVNGDTLTGSLATAATGTSGIGTYSITQGTLSASANYALTYVGADLTVTKRALTVTADAASRAYGDANPSLTYQITTGSLVNGDTLTGALATAATGTSGIGTYSITQGTLSASANYALTYVGADLTVTKRALTVTADTASRAYGDANPSFTYQVTAGTLVNSDTLTGSLTTAATGTSGIGTYAITQGTLSASANYALTYVGADLTVTKRALTVTADAASRVYGDANPSFTYQIAAGSLVNGDTLIGALTTTATGTSGIGTYAITQGTLSASANYALTYVGADLTVTKRALTVTADAASRAYGDANPSLTYQVTSGTLVNGDTLTGALTTTATGTSGIGTYAITQGTLSASTNYALTYVGADLTVTKRALTVTADAASRAYGDANPSFTYQVTSGTLVNGDTLTGGQTTVATGTSGIGTYAITQGTLSASTNYALTYVGADLTVTKRALTVTVDAASRAYGDANPSFTYQVTTGTLVNGDALTGALTTTATGTSGIGTYAIIQGTLSASANYALTYVGADLTVTKRTLTVTADAASRAYGDANPSFTYQIVAGSLVNGDTLTGSLTTAATGTSGIGTYAITQGTLSASANYALTYVGADLTVTKRALTVTADAASRAYGDANPSFTYQIAAGSLVNGDTLTGSLTTAATGTSGVGTYAITQGTFSASANYALTYVGADLTVTKRALTVTADAASRAYGDTNPSFTHQVTAGSLVNGDTFTGAQTTVATGTSGIGTYAITQGTLSASANYALTYVGADLTVTKRALTVTADAASRAYGDANPSFTYQVTTGTLVNGDALTGALATAATGISGIGTYAITQGTLSASANYALTYVGADLTVTKRALTVTADAASRAYGDANPSFTYQVTTGTLVNGDALTGGLTTAATGTSGIGTYAITQGTLSASTNYALTYVGADLTVMKRALTVTADAASRAYGDSNPSFTYQVTTGTLVNGDTLTGALTTAATGISGIGTYAITQGTLAASANYALTYVGADLTVTKRALTVTADAASRAYGDSNPSFTYQVTTSTLVNGDTLTGALATAATGTSGIGTYTITQGTLAASANYALTYVGADLTVTKRALTVTADAASRAYGDTNPSFTYQVTTGTLVNGDTLMGGLTAAATGTSGIGTYAITQGTLSASTNYALTYVGADLTVTKRALTVTADAASRAYGDGNPSFTYQVTTGTLVNGDTLTGGLTTAATGASGIGTYTITQGTLSASVNYALTYVGADLTVMKRALTVTADAASRAYGDGNPSFTYQVTTGTLVNGDTLTGGLTTAATGTSGIGTYAITQGTLSASTNYALTYVGADLTVMKRALTVTADAASRAYGDSNPSFTYQVTTGTLVNGDTLTGALTTAATGISGIGTYAITQGTLAASANYALTYVGADLTVTKRALTVTADAASRAYGDTNPSFTYQVTTGTLVNGDTLMGGLTAAATGTSGIGTYAITQGTLSASTNYALTYVGAGLTVTKRALTVTADAASRAYGDSNPSFTYQVTTGTLVNGDTLTGGLTTAATGTSGIGTYAITQGTLSASTNYALTYVGADLTVTKRALTVTADAASRAYGDTNPSFTYQVTTGTLVNGDTLTGALATAATGTSGIGTYTITQGTLSASANYALTYVGADLTVTKRALTVTADAASRAYGDSNPSLAYQVTEGSLVNGDTLTGALTTTATGTSGIGTYTITQGMLAASANYALTYVGADLTVTKRALTVTADAASRAYGDSNPSFTYQVTTGTLVNGDTLTGALAATATGISGIGTYAITQGTLSASTNYALTYVGADLTVTKRALTVTADAASRAYGDANPSFTYQVTTGTLVNGDTLTGALTTAATGTSGIGTYAITQGTLSASTNYALTYVGAGLTVTKRALTVTADAASRAYGDSNPSLTYQVTTGTLVNGDTLTGGLTTAATGTSGIGTYTITQGTLAASANYALTYVGADLTVTKRALTVTADAASRAYGDSNPSFTYQVTTGTLVNGDTLMGGLTAAATGTSGIGTYTITQGTLSASTNYALTYVGADLTVTKRALTVTADAASRAYGDTNPSFTYQVTTGTLVNGDTLTGGLTTAATGTSGIGTYAITQGTLSASTNYALTYVGADLTVTKRALTVTADAASRAYGDTNPSFTYQVTTGTLVNGDTLTGGLTTAATGTSGIGTYAITQGTLSASTNYALTYVGADLTVTKRALTVTADAASRAYGDTNPSFTYQVTTGTLVNGDTLTGGLTTAATGTSGIGTYTITQGTLAASANYALTYVGADLTVTKRALTVTADAASRAYGDGNPSFTYQVTTGTLVNGDMLTGALAATATGISGIGTYAITQGTLAASANYALTYVGADLTVTKRALTVTADAASRAYGDANPSFTYQATTGTLVNGDMLTGALATAATGTSGIGTYTITQGTLSASVNYALTYVGADLTVTKRALTVTADAASRAYGDSNPSFTYQVTTGTLVNGDTLTGALAATATGISGIGTYAITQGTLAASANYALTYVGADLTVTKRALTVTADAASRAYGDSNPSFTYQVTTGTLVNGDTLMGGLTAAATGTSGIGTYTITQGTLAASANYALTYVGADLTVTKRALTVTADAASRAYGDSNPSFTYQVTTGTLVNGDTLTGALAATATGISGIGTYAITQGTLSASTNYALTYVGADLTVTKRALTVTADAASRAYGEANPSLTYQVTTGTLVNGDTLMGGLTTAATGTSGIGTYTITQGTLAASANYALTYVGADLTVTKRALTVTADAASRAYGDGNPSFTYQVTTGTLVNGDMLTGALATAATGTSGIGTYTITQGTLAASANYALTYVGADLTVTKRALTVTADASSRAYGDTNPSFTYQVTTGTLVNGDTLMGGLTAGATGTSGIGTYTITQGTLSASVNYALTYVGADLTVMKRALTVTADAASRAYGDTNPSFTYQVTTGTLVNGDTLTGGLTTAATGTSGIGTYTITQGTLSASANYALTYVGADLTVTKRALTVTADAASRAYGDSNPSFTYQVTTGTLVNGDMLTGALAATATGISGIGTYAITQGTLSASTNYALTYVGADLTVTKRALTVTADAASRAYGDSNPSFTYQVTTGTLVNGDTLTGAQAATATGISGIGTYAITQGTLAASANYALTYVGADLTVTKRALTVTADAASRAYGDANPSFTYQVTTGTLVNGDTLTGALATAATGTSGIGTYTITQGTLAASVNYALTYVGADLSVTKRALTVTADAASRAYGDSNPSLAYQVTEGSLVNGDTLTGALTTTATGTSGIGTYTITQGTLSASINYALTYVGADLTVTKRALTVTAVDVVKTYGQTAMLSAFEVEGLVSGDRVTAALLESEGAVAGASVRDGGYAIALRSITGDGLSNYDITLMAGRLVVNRAALSVTVDPATRAVGEPDPIFTARYDGFIAGESSEVLGGALAFTTDARATSPAGIYLIRADGLSSANYAITYVEGVLTITDDLPDVAMIETYLARDVQLPLRLRDFRPGAGGFPPVTTGFMEIEVTSETLAANPYLRGLGARLSLAARSHQQIGATAQ